MLEIGDEIASKVSLAVSSTELTRRLSEKVNYGEISTEKCMAFCL
jgi:hypothetical protein